jgi:subtilisin family serine protease
VLFALPSRRDDDRGTATLRTLDEIEEAMGRDVAAPDHVVYLTKINGSLCPATEPEEPGRSGPLPPPAKDRGVGKGVSVSVVDSGWYPGAATDTDSPWLASGVDGDVENLNPASLHPYAGHGTFVAGVIRCVAPATTIEVEGALVNGGAVYESEIVKQLKEAVLDRTDPPQVISISAGTHTRNHAPLMSFVALAEAHGLDKGEGPLIVAAAGNDGNDHPFWPAAFDWVVGVGAVDAEGTVCDFSNHGEWVDVYAHGKDLVNAYPTGTYTCHEPLHAGEVRHFTGLARWSGTSFSTPIVSGLIAAYVSQNGGTARDAWAAISASAVPRTDPRVGPIRIVGPPFA